MPTLTPRDWRGHDWLWRLILFAMTIGVVLIVAVMVFVWWYYN